MYFSRIFKFWGLFWRVSRGPTAIIFRNVISLWLSPWNFYVKYSGICRWHLCTNAWLGVSVILCVCLCAIETTFWLSNLKTKHTFGILMALRKAEGAEFFFWAGTPPKVAVSRVLNKVFTPEFEQKIWPNAWFFSQSSAPLNTSLVAEFFFK